MLRILAVIVGALAMLWATTAAAQDGPAVAACRAAAAHALAEPEATAVVVQDFSGLTPPHVRVVVAANSKRMRLGELVMECVFDSAVPPMALTKFCYEGITCLPPESDAQASLAAAIPLSLEELNYLLDQDGF